MACCRSEPCQKHERTRRHRFRDNADAAKGKARAETKRKAVGIHLPNNSRHCSTRVCSRPGRLRLTSNRTCRPPLRRMRCIQECSLRGNSNSSDKNPGRRQQQNPLTVKSKFDVKVAHHGIVIFLLRRGDGFSGADGALWRPSTAKHKTRMFTKQGMWHEQTS